MLNFKKLSSRRWMKGTARQRGIERGKKPRWPYILLQYHKKGESMDQTERGGRGCSRQERSQTARDQEKEEQTRPALDRRGRGRARKNYCQDGPQHIPQVRVRLSETSHQRVGLDPQPHRTRWIHDSQLPRAEMLSRRPASTGHQPDFLLPLSFSQCK